MLTATKMSVKQLKTWKRMAGASTTIGLLTSDEAPTSTITCCLKEARKCNRLENLEHFYNKAGLKALDQNLSVFCPHEINIEER